MDTKDEKFKIEVQFSKNRHYPQYGNDAYSIESHSVYIPYGKRFYFKNSNAAISFVKEKIDSKILEHFDSIYITKWRGYRGTSERLKDSSKKSDTNPIDKSFVEILLSY